MGSIPPLGHHQQVAYYRDISEAAATLVLLFARGCEDEAALLSSILSTLSKSNVAGGHTSYFFSVVLSRDGRSGAEGGEESSARKERTELITGEHR